MGFFTADSVAVTLRGTRILTGLYLSVAEGERVGLLGVNGSGKTTLFRCLTGEIRDATGVVHIRGRYVAPAHRWKHIAYLNQIGFLPRDRSVRKGASLFAGAAGIRALREDERAASLLHRRVGALSGGERRYVEFLLVLQLDRDVTLLDEPFAQIEPLYVERMHAVLRNRRRGSFVITDHNHVDVRKVCARLLILRDGRIGEVADRESDLVAAHYLPPRGNSH